MSQNKCCTQLWYYPKSQYLFIHTSPISSCTLFIIRLISALYFTAANIIRFHNNYNSLLRVIIRLTNLGLFITNIYFILVIQDRIFGHKYKYNMRNFIITIYEIALSYEIIITIVYWAFLYDGQTDSLLLYYNINGHGLPVLALLLQFIFNPYSFYIKRSLITLSGVIIYLIINVAYTLDYQPVYQIVTWKNAISYGLLIGSIVLVMVTFGLGILAYNCCCKKKKLNQMIQSNIQEINFLDLDRFKKTEIQTRSQKIQG